MQAKVDNLNSIQQKLDNYNPVEKFFVSPHHIVYKARCSKTGNVVFLKKISLEGQTEGVPSTAIREISMIKKLKHKNVVQLFDVILTSKNLYMILEYLDFNLRKIILLKHSLLTGKLIKSYMYQILDGVNFCHASRVLHRDLKPFNLLVNATGYIKITDFGGAREFHVPMRPLTHEVTSLWYRAPEVLLGSKYYTTSLDIWSVGIIFCEMITGEPLLPGKSEIDQICKIFRRFSTPDEKKWPGVTQLPDFKMNFPNWPVANLPISIMLHEGYDLILKLLKYAPSQRLTAKNAMKHKYFNNVEHVHNVDLPKDVHAGHPKRIANLTC